MQKQKLSAFINKYYLNGQGDDKVTIQFNEDCIKTVFYGPDKSMIGFVKLNEGLELGNIGIFQTPVLVKLLSAFNDDDDLDITTTKNSADIVTNLTITCNDTVVNATTADPEIVTKIDTSKINEVTMMLNTEPPYVVEFDINSVFMEQFKRYASASSAEIFAFIVKDSTFNIVMNYSTNNTNQIKFTTPAQISSDSDFVICFKVAMFTEIFNNNKNCTGNIKISKAGISRIDISDENYDCRYYPVQVLVQNQ